MQDINKKIVLFTVIAVIIIGIITFLFIYFSKQSNAEPLIDIDGVNFTLNSIKEDFLTTEYAQDNKCNGEVYEKGIRINCNKIAYDFSFNDYELELSSSNENSKDVFKYMVNSIEKLHGYSKDEYLETIDKFFDGQIAINGLKYTTENGNHKYSVYVLEKLDKYNSKEVITEPTIKDIADNNYEFQSNGYTINNIEVEKNPRRNSVVFSAVIGGKDTYNTNFTINLYDANNNLVSYKTVDLSTYESFGYPYIAFVVTTMLDDQTMYDSIARYSITLS